MFPTGLHHISKRKRISTAIEVIDDIKGIGDKTLRTIKRRLTFKKLELYPSNKFWIKFLDKFLIIVATVGPLTTFPQIWKIFSQQNAAGLSLFSWLSWALLNIPWILYGLVHKDKPIITAYILWFLMNLTVVIGIFMYG